MKCRHLSISEEAYRDSGAGMEAAPAYICGWAVERLAVTPIWFNKLNGGGHMITDPASSCNNCPCFERDTASAT